MGWQGENVTGVQTLCMGCQEKCLPFQPDGFVCLKMCATCWGKLSIVQRSMLTLQARQAKELSDLVCLIHDVVRSGEVFDDRRRKNEGN